MNSETGFGIQWMSRGRFLTRGHSDSAGAVHCNFLCADIPIRILSVNRSPCRAAYNKELSRCGLGQSPALGLAPLALFVRMRDGQED
jgi:hypothetical protein